MKIMDNSRLLFLFILIFLVTICNGQFDYGLNVIYNSSTHTNSNPTLPEDGTTQWIALGTWGGGGFIKKRLSPKFAANVSLNYQQKGYKEIAQIGLVPGGIINEYRLRNTFNYLSTDFSITYKIFSVSTLDLCINLGAEYNYLLNYKIRSDFIPLSMFYPVNAYQDKWEKNNLSILPSISFTFDRATTFEFGFNGSLTPVLKTENLIVKDWIWTVRISQSIPMIFNKTS